MISPAASEVTRQRHPSGRSIDVSPGGAGLFMLSALCGPGLGSHGIYLSHLLMPIVMVMAGVLKPDYRANLRSFFALATLFLLFIAYSSTQVIFGSNVDLLLRNYLHVGISLATLIMVFFLARQYRTARMSIRVLEIFIWLMLLISCVEMTVGIRLPVSRYQSGELADPSVHLGLVTLNTPTAFFGNENNLALVLLLTIVATPLLPRSRRIILLMAQGGLLLACGSRLISVMAVVVLLALSVVSGLRLRTALLYAIVPTLLVAFGYFADPTCQEWLSPRVCLLVDIVVEAPDLEVLALGADSIGVRASLWSQAIAAIFESPWLGVGPGGLSPIVSAQHADAGVVSSLHNPPLEIMAEYGGIGAVFWLGGYIFTLCALFKSQVKRTRSCAVLALLVLPLGSPAVSTIYYFTPVWALLGLLLGLSLRKESKSCAVRMTASCTASG